MALNSIAPAPAAEKTLCFHCGADCIGHIRYHADKPFCCDGCSTVFQILNENGLDAYYDLNAHPGTRSETGRYAFLDHADMVDKFLDFREGDHCRITLRIPAIHCTSCIWLLEHLYQVQDGVLRSEVNFPRKEAYIHFDASIIDLRSLVELLDRLGYPPTLSLQTLEGAKPRRIDRRILFQLGVAGFCFGNIMLLSFPEYIGLADLAFAQFFGWLNILLAVPVVAFSAQDYFRSAWNGLRTRRINMDVPIALGIAVLFLRSSYDIISGTGAGYLDSMAGLVFFLLIGKLYQSKTYALLAFDRDYKSYFPIAVTRLDPTGEVNVPLSELQAGDRLLVRNGEMIPADAVLLRGEAFMDYSFVTGESDPVPKQGGDLLYAGGRQAGSAIEVETIREVSQSYLTQLWSNETFQKKQESRVTELSNRAGRIFTFAILAVALVTGVVWALIDPSRVMLIVTAVLIVACPCALALATPFTLGNALRILGRSGLFLKGPAVVERLAGVDTVVFDKTGTLTRAGEAEVTYSGTDIPEADTARLKSLLRHSTHPLSRQLFAALPGRGELEVEDFVETPGQGLAALVGGKPVQIGSASYLRVLGTAQGDGSEVHVRIGGHYRGVYRLGNAYREGLAPLLNALQPNYELALLTGDTPREEAHLTAAFPAITSLRFQQSPQDKLEAIRTRQEAGHSVLMIGDGLNDAGALQQSKVGIAVADDIAAFTPASDAILSAAAFEKLPRFLRFSQDAIRLIKASFVLSLLYNIVGLAFAVTGHLSPLVAAILMPASSVSVILFTTVTAKLLARKRKL